MKNKAYLYFVEGLIYSRAQFLFLKTVNNALRTDRCAVKFLQISSVREKYLVRSPQDVFHLGEFRMYCRVQSEYKEARKKHVDKK
jgi:hypothetical protein